ncbi:MAG: NB-ARC domain-containing protein [Chloroflexota bacterium]
MATADAISTFDLTEREIEILEHLNEGLRNQDIADRTGLTLYTVKWYLKQIYSKLYVSNRTQAATKARELGLFAESVKIATRTMASIRTNLPEIVTSFFGREQELTHIKHLLIKDDVRLVTVHGIGGMGKTRLALEIAHQFLPVFQEGVYFIPLDSTSDNPLIQVMHILSLAISEGLIVDQLGRYLHNKHMLLVFDNFEHLLPYAKELSTLLEKTNRLRLLVTSREILNLRGEHVVSLSGLDFNKDNSAYQLYQERAKLGTTEFSPDEHEQLFIHKICELVGGMPLAIEMAAGWTSVMLAEDIYQRIQHNIDMLTSDEHDRPERHQSIRATFDSSLEMLSQDLQKAFIKLGVFHPEGFSLEGAEVVAELSPLDIKQLLQTALIQRDMSGRFKFHPLIRQYINTLLKSDTKLRIEAKKAHGDYYYDFSQRLVASLYTDNFQLNIIDNFRLEGGNLFLAWKYALQQGYYDWLLTASEVGYITEMAGDWQSSRKLFSETLQAIPENKQLLRGRLLAMLSIFEARLYNLDRLEKTARESWNLLKDSAHIYDARTAMIYLAILKTVMKDNEGAFDLLDEIDKVDIPAHCQPNAYVDSLHRIAHPLSLLYAGELEKALPLLEKAHVPLWSEAVIYLPECYYLLGMEEHAHQLLIRLFTASLDNKNHRLAQTTSFYLALIENDRETIAQGLPSKLIELTRMGFKYKFIAQNAYYYGVTLLMRGLRQQAYYSWYGCLSLLDYLDEIALQYQYALQMASHLRQRIPSQATHLLMAIAHDDKCPESIRIEAHKDLAQLLIEPDVTPTKVYDILLDNM